MARVRALNPGYFLDDELAECDPLARILFAGLWCVADREGRVKDRPRRIKPETLPYDDCDIDALLAQLADRDMIYRYAVDGLKYIAIPSWHRYQKPHYKEAESIIPPPSGQAWAKLESRSGQAWLNVAPSSSSSSSSSMDPSPNKDLCPKCRKGHHDIELSYDEDGKLHCALCGYQKRGRP